MDPLDTDQLLEIIEQIADKAVKKVLLQFNHEEEKEALIQQRKRGKHNEQIEESESFR